MSVFVSASETAVSVSWVMDETEVVREPFSVLIHGGHAKAETTAVIARINAHNFFISVPP